jgi:hypothetical protein
MAGLRHGPLWPLADEIIPILAGVNDGPMAASGPLTVPRSGGPRYVAADKAQECGGCRTWQWRPAGPASVAAYTLMLVALLPRRPLRPRASPNGAQVPFGAGSLFAPTPSHCSARTPAETDLSAAR